ncbi:MAG TPA: carbamate kinase [Candidatus Saccharimonadales bacterium]|nr:carbamate kinase [Candidatus Saccharimonadales bacterium]
MPDRLIVIALGGNALLQRDQKGTFEEQYGNVKKSVAKIAELVQQGYKVVLTHGNGPQVGATLIRHEAAKNIVPVFPLDACGAETQGFIGYMIQQALRNEFKSRGIDKFVVTVISRVIVDRHDIAFQRPTKPIGPFYSKEEASKLKELRPDLTIKEDAGRGYRRVVPSPDPKIIAERNAIRALVDAGFIVIACGGGGIPIIEDATLAVGVEAVIDKDLAGQKLATLIGAHIFVILTNIDAAYLNYGTAKQERIGEISSGKLRNHLNEGHFKEGSMAPKIEAAIRFVESGGERAIIAELGKLVEALDGKTGTQVVTPKA